MTKSGRIIYWAWRESHPRDKCCPYWNIYPRKFLVEMCSPDGFKTDEEKGRGKLVQVEISEIPEEAKHG